MGIISKKHLSAFLFVIIANLAIMQKVTSANPLKTELDCESIYSPACSSFSLWSPAANEVILSLYTEGIGGEPFRKIRMEKFNNGFWTVKVDSDLKGKFYTFQVNYKGKWLKETPGIFAKAVGVNGDRAAIIDFKSTDPEGWANDKRPEVRHFTDIVIYEIHHRDFSVSDNSGIQYKGKFLALTEHGTKNDFGQSTGIDHLKELGITHVHLLPSFDFGSIDETRLAENKYNWGYDPKNFNVPEGSYSTDPYSPAVRIREFKEMVMALHKSGIGVILDVVYNHTHSNDYSNFSLTAPGYFYRYKKDGSYSNASGCNNETASEKTMMRRFMLESVKYWVNEYHIDGFRFDLMGVHDIETMNDIRKELDEIDPGIFIYGEGWTAGSSTLPENLRAVKKNGLKLPGIAVFSDDLRDAVKGSWNDHKAAGFVGGKAGLEESVRFGIVGAIFHPQVNYSKVNYSKAPYANNPGEVINYVSCHDDMCLNDKLKAAAGKNATLENLKAQNKLAQTIVFTSQGVPFMLSGEELYRSKKGVSNSFESPDSINRLNWNNKYSDNDIYEYYRELIRLRSEHPAFRMYNSADVRDHLNFLSSDSCLVAYLIKGNANGDKWGDILVIHNGRNKNVKVNIPDGEWISVISDGKIDLNGIRKFSGKTVVVSPVSSIVAYK